MHKSEGAALSDSRERAVREELDRLLQSAAFRTSKRCREFLEHTVEHTIHGPSDALKERSIGVELFQLPPDFDTGQHTIVRVTANEVRKKLAQHYLAENGSFHPVRIELPPGSYVAEFRWQVSPPDPIPAPTTIPAPEPEVLLRQRWRTHRVITATVAIILFAGAYALWQWHALEPRSGEPSSVVAAAPIPNLPATGDDLRIIVGSKDPYVDRSGRTWRPDQYFSGGSVRVRPSESVRRTLDPDIYRHVRLGEFRYDIPLKPGSYELHLHFAETGLADFISAESSGEGQRVFRVYANGERILDLFDVVADAAGANLANERVFRNISPAEDGFLHLNFESMRGTAILSGIEILPVSPGKVRPVRIRAGWTTAWQDPAGRQWRADSYFLGGNALVRAANPAREINVIRPDLALYASERWGHFSYAIPVAEGRYRVNLKFCEGHYGRRNTGVGGVGSRVFDVYCNGVALLRDFDISKEAGGEGRPVDRTFSGIRPTAQGKIVLTFVPIKGMACVNGVEVVEDSK
jgi:hypothetical protein